MIEVMTRRLNLLGFRWWLGEFEVRIFRNFGKLLNKMKIKRKVHICNCSGSIFRFLFTERARLLRFDLDDFQEEKKNCKI